MHQPWITPSIFENTGNTSIIDEYTLGQSQNNATTRAIMQNHWDTVRARDSAQRGSAEYA
jgi:glucan 1,3-beta-glucosidase